MHFMLNLYGSCFWTEEMREKRTAEHIVIFEASLCCHYFIPHFIYVCILYKIIFLNQFMHVLRYTFMYAYIDEFLVVEALNIFSYKIYVFTCTAHTHTTRHRTMHYYNFVYRTVGLHTQRMDCHTAFVICLVRRNTHAQHPQFRSNGCGKNRCKKIKKHAKL